MSCVFASPQNPHKSGSAAVVPTRNPRTKRHYPAYGGTTASMVLLALQAFMQAAGMEAQRGVFPWSGTDPLVGGSSSSRCPYSGVGVIAVLNLGNL
jgi:hypothetical protein